MQTTESIKRQNAPTWVTVTNGDGPFRAGLFINQDVLLTLTDLEDNTEDFTFLAGTFVPLDIKEVTSGATGNGVIGCLLTLTPTKYQPLDT